VRTPTFRTFYIYNSICKKVRKSGVLDSSHVLTLYNHAEILTCPERLEATKEALAMLFVSRFDKIGEQLRNSKYVVHDQDQNIFTMLEEHLKGKRTYAITPFDAFDVALWCGADFDDHTGEKPRYDDVKAFTRFCAEKGIPCIVMRSGSHSGHHVIIPIAPVDTFTAYKFIRQLLHDAPVPNKDHIDLFPMNKKPLNSKKTARGYGNQLRIPLGFNWKAKCWSDVVDPVSLEPTSKIDVSKVLLIRPVQVREKAQKREKDVEKVQNKNHMVNGFRDCLERALREDLEGSNGHATRVAVACEALNCGMSEAETVELFKGQRDFVRAVSEKNVKFIFMKGYKAWSCKRIAEKCAPFVNCAQCPYQQQQAATGEVI